MMVEISGQEKKIEAFIDAVRPYGIRELARTGRIAMVRGLFEHAEETPEEPEATDAPAVIGHSSL